MGPGVILDGVSLHYDGTSSATLRGISLEVASGELVVLAGCSGSGKSTLLRTINGLVPDFYPAEVTGRIELERRRIEEFASHELAQRVGTVFQDPRSEFFTTTVLDEVAFGAENLSLPSGEINRRTDAAIGSTGISALRDRSIFGLSSGQKQLTAIASVLAMEPGLLVMDEPSANLDAPGTAALSRIIANLKRVGHTMVIAEHRLAYLMPLADRVVHLENGVIAHTWSPQAFAELPVDVTRELGLRRAQSASTEEAPRTHHDARLVLHDADLTAGGTRVARNLTITMGAGSGAIVGISGPVGCGKTTLARTLCGLNPLKRGSITFDGARLSRRQLRRRAFFVMQDTDYQLFSDTVDHELVLCAPSLNVGERSDLLASLGLDGLETRHPGSLSGGQKQRLAIAGALASASDILVLDEPTSGLDGRSMLEVAAMLRAAATSGRLVIVTSHDADFLAECCTELVTMSA